RREAQIRAQRPDLDVVPLRGNVDTRLRKLREGEMDALVIAAAGLRRLGREKEVTEFLSPEVMLPASAQGVVCVTALKKNESFLEILKAIDDSQARTCAQAERAFLKTLQGGCRVPVGALAIVEGDSITLSGVIADPKTRKIMKNSMKGGKEKPLELGQMLARQFLRDGAGDILESFGRSTW
ncbi:MAG TPA: hydroxymethylbilane synthase, partial [bacterium]|nr:hydroxymethylbilane synthase [bacterium]